MYNYPNPYISVTSLEDLYVFSFYVRSAVNALQSRLSVWTTDPGYTAPNEAYIGNTFTTSNTGWTRIHMLFSPTTVGTIGSAWYMNWTATGQINYVDSYLAEKVSKEELTYSTTNAITNPSAEVNTTNTFGGNCTLTRVNTWASHGSWSFQLSSPSNGDCFLAVDGDVGAIRNGAVKGKTYRIRGTVRLTAPIALDNARALRIVVHLRSPNGYITKVSKQAPNVAGVYDMEMFVTIPNYTTEFFVRYYHGGTSGTVWWDDLSMNEVTNYPVKEYFDGDTVPVSDDYLSRWDGVEGTSTSTLTRRTTNTTPASGGVLTSYTVFEAIGEASAERVEVIPSGVTAYGAGGRTELTHKGLEVFSASNQALLRLGHDIDTGLEIRNQNTGLMTPLSPMVFGTTSKYYGSTITFPDVANGTTGGWNRVDIQDFTISSPTTSSVVQIGVTAGTSTGNWFLFVRVDILNSVGSVVTNTPDIFVSGGATINTSSDLFAVVKLPSETEEYTARLAVTVGRSVAGSGGTPSISNYSIVSFPV